MSDDHIIKLPLWVWIVKIVQAVFAVLVLALTGYEIDRINKYESHFVFVSTSTSNVSDGFSLGLFTAIFTLLILGYYFGSLHFFQIAYNWIAVLVLECLAVVFWLATFADIADNWNKVGDDLKNYVQILEDVGAGAAGTWKTFTNIFQTALAFSVLNWVLFVVTLVFLSLGIHAHRTEGKPMLAGGAHNTDVEKIEVQNMPAANAAPAQPQPQPQPVYDQSSTVSPAPSPYPPAPGPYNPPPTSVSPPPANVHEAM